MKKVLFFALFITSSLLAEAQGIGFSIGPKIGYNSNTLTDNLDSIRTSIKNSLQIGAFMRIGSKFYFQPEANYQVVSGTLNKSNGSSIQSQDYTLKSVKIPAILGYKLINKGILTYGYWLDRLSHLFWIKTSTLRIWEAYGRYSRKTT